MVSFALTLLEDDFDGGRRAERKRRYSDGSQSSEQTSKTRKTERTDSSEKTEQTRATDSTLLSLLEWTNGGRESGQHDNQALVLSEASAVVARRERRPVKRDKLPVLEKLYNFRNELGIAPSRGDKYHLWMSFSGERLGGAVLVPDALQRAARRAIQQERDEERGAGATEYDVSEDFQRRMQLVLVGQPEDDDAGEDGGAVSYELVQDDYGTFWYSTDKAPDLEDPDQAMSLGLWSIDGLVAEERPVWGDNSWEPHIREDSKDDLGILPYPSRNVDYLQYEWSEEEIWLTVKHLKARRGGYSNGARLENAAWRQWLRTRNNRRHVDPKSLNWLRDNDVTWLYGPLIQAPTSTPAESPRTAKSTRHLTASRRVQFEDEATVIPWARSESSEALHSAEDAPAPITEPSHTNDRGLELVGVTEETGITPGSEPIPPSALYDCPWWSIPEPADELDAWFP